MSTFTEALEASQAKEKALEEMAESLRSSTPADRLRFAIGICPIVDKGGEGNEAFAAVVKATAKETDPMLDAFKALGKEDRFRTVARVLALIEQDKLTAPRNGSRRVPANGEATIVDTVVAVVQASRAPVTTAEILEKVQKTIPDVKPDTVRFYVNAKKQDGTFSHDEEAHTYSMA